MLENKKVGFVVNILLAVIVLSFLIWGLYAVIIFNKKNETLEALGYDENIVYNRVAIDNEYEEESNQIIENFIEE